MLSVADMGREVISQRRKERDQLIMGQGRRRSRVQPPKVRKSTTTRLSSLLDGAGGRHRESHRAPTDEQAAGGCRLAIPHRTKSHAHRGKLRSVVVTMKLNGAPSR